MEDIDDGGLVGVEAGGEFLFEGSELAGEAARVGERGAHRDERTDHEDAYLDGLRAVEEIGGHDGAVFGEGVGAGLWGAMALRGTGHNL